MTCPYLPAEEVAGPGIEASLSDPRLVLFQKCWWEGKSWELTEPPVHLASPLEALLLLLCINNMSGVFC